MIEFGTFTVEEPRLVPVRRHWTPRLTLDKLCVALTFRVQQSDQRIRKLHYTDSARGRSTYTVYLTERGLEPDVYHLYHQNQQG